MGLDFLRKAWLKSEKELKQKNEQTLNTAIHIDTKPDCPSCDFNRNEEIANYCEVCGKALR